MPQPKTAQSSSAPALAPDGHHLAYFVCVAGDRPVCDLDVVELDDSGKPVSTPRACGEGPLPLKAASPGAATARPCLYTTQPRRRRSTCGARGSTASRAPERLELAGLGARMPTIASARDRLVFVALAQHHRRLHAGGCASSSAPRRLLGHPAAVLARRHPARLQHRRDLARGSTSGSPRPTAPMLTS